MGESNGGDVDISRFTDGLVISRWIGEDQKTGLHELLLDLIGESTGCESSRDGLSTSVVGELEGSTLSPRSSRGNANVVGVFNGNNHASSELKLFPGLLEVDDVDAITTSSPNVSGHGWGHISSSEVDLASEHLLDVIFLGV